VIAVSDNVLYGTTIGGRSNQLGAVFQLTRTAGETWKETGLYSFETYSDGAFPSAGLLLHNGASFGTTGQGGGNANAGTVFEISH
jgi:uncharacterized repeat protein (TIGR03803 family)